MNIDELTATVIGVCIKIHSAIGPGCFEKVYEEILFYELTKLGLIVERQLYLPIAYESLYIKDAYKIDLLVENMLLIEIKSIHPLPAVFFKQVRTQLTLINLKYGLLLNFKEDMMKNGIHRVYNNAGQESLRESLR